MSRALVTGATGLVGFNIVQALRRRGADVRCLARSPDRARSVLGEGVEVVHGDLTDETSIDAAVRDCSTVFHAAGLPEQWLADPSNLSTSQCRWHWRHDCRCPQARS